MDKAIAASYGIDYDKGLKNCMNNIAFYKKILSMFLADKCFSYAVEAYTSGNIKELFCRMHELKGISGNAALTDLYQASVPLVELLRHNESTEADEVRRLFQAVENAYGRACDGINVILAQ